MSRNLTAAANNAAQAEIVRPVILCKLEYDGGPVLANTSPYKITYAGDDFLGVGNLGNISAVPESIELMSKGLTLTLSGIPSSMVSIALSENPQDRPATIWLAFLDENHKLIPDPVELFSGLMDTQSIKMGDTAVVTVTVESRLADWERQRSLRFTHEEQQELFAGDMGLEFVAKIEDIEIIWGRA